MRFWVAPACSACARRPRRPPGCSSSSGGAALPRRAPAAVRPRTMTREALLLLAWLAPLLAFPTAAPGNRGPSLRGGLRWHGRSVGPRSACLRGSPPFGQTQAGLCPAASPVCVQAARQGPSKCIQHDGFCLGRAAFSRQPYLEGSHSLRPCLC